jgi:formate--tetrahydrofolate ligase
MEPFEPLLERLAVPSGAWEPFGRRVAKVDANHPEILDRPRKGKVVLITGMTPTGHGVGKTVTMLSLASALHRRGTRVMACLRQPSMGPVFGIKGGGAGGGRATVEPFVEVNLGLTGDLDAVTNAHNLLAALIDNHLHHGNSLNLDPETVLWPRALDVEDRALRHLQVGLGPGNGPPRTTSFVITPASEVTAILGLAESPEDLTARLGRILIGKTRAGRFLRASDLRAEGAMAAILRKAIRPNLLTTPEGAPVLVHGGPFGNLSYGTTTLRSIHLAQRLADVVLVEAGFGTDLGGEKFVDLVAPQGDFAPAAAVVVASVPGIRAHSAGGPDSLAPGLENLEKHLENVRAFGLEPVVAVNQFPDDSEADLQAVADLCATERVGMARTLGFAEGGKGAEALGEVTLQALRAGRQSHPIYAVTDPLPQKIDTVVRTVYGGDGADFSPEAVEEQSSGLLEGTGRFPVCLAKTPLSLTDDPKRLGRPRGFRVQVKSLVPAAGAGYLVALLGRIETMPGLPGEPRALEIRLGADGTVLGVS